MRSNSVGATESSSSSISCEISNDHRSKSISNNNNGKLNRDLESAKPPNLRTRILDVRNRKRSYGTALGFGGDCGGDGGAEEQTSTSDIIGNFGWFQFLVLLFSGLREASVGYDAVVMSILLQPPSLFFCQDSSQQELLDQMSSALGESPANSSQHQTLFTPNDTAQCYQHDGATRCDQWVFPHHNPSYGASLIAEWQLVCHRHWLVAFVESSYFLGLVTGNLVWGYCADRMGRRPAYIWAHFLALVAGLSTLFAPNVYLFSLSRFLSAFGSISYNIIYSIQVELIGTKYRAFSTTMNHLGWGIGVICVPLVDHLFADYHYIIAVAPLVTLLMFPFAFWLPESSRWLMVKGDFQAASQVLVRVARFNGRPVGPETEKRIVRLQNRVNKEKRQQEASNGGLEVDRKRPYRLLFSDPVLVRDTIALSYVSFTGHLFYYLLTINFAYMKNLSVEANFIISGAGEWVSVVVGAILIRLFSRKTCMSLFLFLIGFSFVFQMVIDARLAPHLDTPLVVTTINAVGTLSGLLLVFITLIVNQEIYPTVIRQTGSSIVNTLGESGSTLAPMLLQLVRLIGLWKADLIYAVFCFAGMVGVQFISDTEGELMDA